MVTRSSGSPVLFIPLFSMTRAWSCALFTPTSLPWTSLLRIKSRISLYLSLLFYAELLTTILMASQLFDKETKTINARISSSKSISNPQIQLKIHLECEILTIRVIKEAKRRLIAHTCSLYAYSKKPFFKKKVWRSNVQGII